MEETRVIRRFGKRFLLICAITAALLGLLWFANREEEYVIQGRTLKEWILLANNGDHLGQKCMRTLGPEAIEPLGKLLRDGPSPLNRIYLGLWLKLSPAMRKRIPVPEYDVRPDAVRYLEVHGELAAPAVDEIVEYMEDTQELSYGRLACYTTLKAIGRPAREALPALLRRAESATDENDMLLVCVAIGAIGDERDHEIAARLASLARGTNGPMLRISCAMGSHSVKPNPALLREVLEPLFSQWKRTMQIDDRRAHMARMHFIEAVTAIAWFDTRTEASQIARETAEELGDRRLLRSIAAALDPHDPEPVL